MTNNLAQAKQLIQACQNNQTPYLDLGNCGITNLNDLPELFECWHLETLILSNTWWNAEKKVWIDSENTGIENILCGKLPTSFQAFQNLKTLKIGGDYKKRWSINDTFILSDLKQLQSLYLRSHKISNYNFVKELKQLKTLYLSNNQIRDISFLKNLNQLQALYLNSNQISNISFLKNLNQLQTLNLRSNKISDYSFLKNLNQLQILYLRSNKISDISFLKNLKLLQSLVMVKK